MVSLSSLTASELVVSVAGVGKHYTRHRGQRSLIRELLFLERWRRSTQLWPLRNFDLQIKAGEVLGLIGRNGCGTTTLLSLIAGASFPSNT